VKNRTIHRHGAVTVYVSPVGEDQVYITASVAEGSLEPASAAATAYRQIAEVLGRRDMEIVHERIFGSISAQPAVIQARDEATRKSGLRQRWPVTYIQGRPLGGEGLAGLSIQAVRTTQAEDNIWSIYSDDILLGRGWKRNGDVFLMLQNMHGLEQGPEDRNSLQMQAGRMFQRTEKILRAHGATYRNVARTWIYLSNILDWYDEFNEARNAEYREFGIIPDSPAGSGAQQLWLPASTGIGGENPLGAACVMDVLAVVPRSQQRPKVEQMTNIKQEDAFLYGSAFSRGVCITEPNVTEILISGTAAIDENGRSLHPGDVRGQILRTFDNVETLIKEKGAGLQDICEATVFLKHPEDAPVYQQAAAERGLTDMPAVRINADICRDDLLFELDGVAAVHR